MAIQQIMIAQRIAAASAGLPPTSLTGLTFWYDGDGSVAYQGPASTAPLATANNDPLQRSDSAGGINRVISGGSLSRKIPVFGSANGYQNVAASQDFSAKPAAGANPSVPTTLDNLFNNNLALIVMAINVVNLNADSGSPFGNPCLLGEVSGYFGLFAYRSGGNIVFQGYNYDGTDDVRTVTVPVSTWAVITVRHQSGNLQIRRDGGTWSTVASGNTSVLTGVVTQTPQTTSDFSVAQFCTADGSNTDAAILEVERNFGAKVGITI